MNGDKRITAAGAVLVILAIACAVFLCTNTRIDPAVRTAYETQAQPVDQSGDFALFLQMTGVQDTTAAPEKPSGVVPYGLALGAAALAGLILFCLCVPRGKRGAALFAGGLSLLLGFVLARLVFWICNASFYLGLYSDPLSLFRVRDGGLCMTGALLGAGLGCYIASRVFRDSELSFPALADAMAPGAALFIACERCHEWVLLKQNYGLPAAAEGILTAQGDYGPVMNTARISSLAALIILAVIMTIRCRKTGSRGILFLLLYGTIQVLLESLRQDLHMLWGFVHIQQLTAFLAVFAVMIILSVPQHRTVRTVIVSLAAAGVFIFLEFALDGRIRPPFAFMEQNVKLCWYIVFGIVLAAYLVYGLLLFRKYGKETPEP